ncbi:MAG: hypothetical protein P1P88_22675, partial [Bacteroidales bacterium]|nr:hypothetical protein [Bacteroidales bacterium]
NKQGMAQEDPITEALQEEKQDYLGAKLSASEYEELQRINTKYQLTEKVQELRSRQRSGQKLGLMDRFRIGKANRKDYLRAKKLDKFRKKKVLSKQNDATRKRMKENEKKANASYKKNKRRQKMKSFFNLFR